MVAKTHPVEATPDHPLSASRKEGEKNKKNGVYPLCGAAGERVGQRSAAGVSRSQRLGITLMKRLLCNEKYYYNL
jgi:hypothetical protein